MKNLGRYVTHSVNSLRAGVSKIFTRHKTPCNTILKTKHKQLVIVFIEKRSPTKHENRKSDPPSNSNSHLSIISYKNLSDYVPFYNFIDRTRKGRRMFDFKELSTNNFLLCCSFDSGELLVRFLYSYLQFLLCISFSPILSSSASPSIPRIPSFCVGLTEANGKYI